MIITGLVNRLKERRKPPRKASSVTKAIVKKEEPKKPAINQNQVEIPAGEDNTSFERHNRLLSIEYSKTKRNEANVKELMKISFAMRRNDILENGHSFDILQKYPFLQIHEHVRYTYLKMSFCM